jgi:hypothetical protein
MKPPIGYRIIFLPSTPACFWTNDDGNSGPTHHFHDSSTYVKDCVLEAWKHEAAGFSELDEIVAVPSLIDEMKMS